MLYSPDQMTVIKNFNFEKQISGKLNDAELPIEIKKDLNDLVSSNSGRGIVELRVRIWVWEVHY